MNFYSCMVAGEGSFVQITVVDKNTGYLYFDDVELVLARNTGQLRLLLSIKQDSGN